jgi:UDP-N-acetylglucosamine 1-carboxyvinyltransferase
MKQEKFVIEGLGGAKTLQGEIAVAGAKNAVLKSIAASFLFEDEVRIENVPGISDVTYMGEIVADMGCVVAHHDHTITVTPGTVLQSALPDEKARKFRASIVLTGPVLARTGAVSFPYPGGDKIGLRPIDLFLEGFKKMGADIAEEGDTIHITAPTKGLQGAEFFFRRQSVTGTEALMMAAVLAHGTTVLENAAMEPEIQDLADFLNACGAHIIGAGTHTITIKGGRLLRAKGKACVTPPDRIEAGSFLILGALTARDLRVTHCRPHDSKAVVEALEYAGVPIEVHEDSMHIVGNTMLNRFFGSPDVVTHEYPGFPTDLQAPMTVFLTQTTGESIVFETIWEDRFRYIDALRLMGADVTQMDQHRVLVRGATTLTGQPLASPDIRAGLAYMLAALVADGTSHITGVHHIDRGYEHIAQRLQALGAPVERVEY